MAMRLGERAISFGERVRHLAAFLQSRVRRALAESMQSHDGFEKISVGERFRRLVEIADRERAIECIAYFSFICRLDPDQRAADVTCFQRSRGCLDHRAIDGVAMAKGLSGQQNCQQQRH